ncbi:MAG: glycosyltransferase [Elioraea sp.]|nr:glycosyltransferase [Elioraea sp.]
MPPLSVVCPFRDTPPAFLREAAASVLAEAPATVGELLLVDDASVRADTREAAAAIAEADPRVRLLRLERNSGPAGARNAGVAEARHEWVAFVDSDDRWLPGRGEAMMDVLRLAPDAAWIGGDYTEADAGDGAPPPAAAGPRRLEGEALARAFLDGFFLHLGASAMRRSLFAQAGGFDTRLRVGEDVYLNLVLATLVPLHHVPRCLYWVRRGHPSLTASRAMLREGDMPMLRRARRDPRLAALRRELRWALYREAKRLAASNLVSGFRRDALLWALRAWALDPRELGELATFLRILFARPAEVREEALRAYTRALLIRLPATA